MPIRMRIMGFMAFLHSTRQSVGAPDWGWIEYDCDLVDAPASRPWDGQPREYDSVEFKESVAVRRKVWDYAHALLLGQENSIALLVQKYSRDNPGWEAGDHQFYCRYRYSGKPRAPEDGSHGRGRLKIPNTSQPVDQPIVW